MSGVTSPAPLLTPHSNPTNLNTPQVADFGLSKQKQATYVSGVTSLRGTLPWTAPEIIKSPKEVDEKVRGEGMCVCVGGRAVWERGAFLTAHHVRSSQRAPRPSHQHAHPTPPLAAPPGGCLLVRHRAVGAVDAARAF